MPESSISGTLKQLVCIAIIVISLSAICFSVEIVYSGYLGGVNSDKGFGLAVNNSNSVILTGMTASPDFPTCNAYDSSFNGLWDGYVSSLSNSGNILTSSTFIGGLGGAQSYAMAIDDQGNIYITGKTNAEDFPAVQAFDSTYNGGGDAFIAKFSAKGNSLIFSTYLGGAAEDWGDDILIDNQGNIIVVGNTESSNFPSVNGFDSTFNGGSDIFIAKLSQRGDSLLYCSFLGSDLDDYATSVAVDNNDCAVIVGKTNSANFPAVNNIRAFQGGLDAIVTKVSSSGGSLLYSSCLGGEGNEQANDVKIDNHGNCIITGWTTSIDFPIKNALDSCSNGDYDIFVAKFRSGFQSLEFSTYLGGEDRDIANGMALDDDGNIYLIGETESGNFPIIKPISESIMGNSDIFISRLSGTGKFLEFSSFYGGSGTDIGNDIALDSRGCIYMTGITASTDFPTVSSIDSTHNGGVDAFVVKINRLSESEPPVEPPPDPVDHGGCYPNPFNNRINIQYSVIEPGWVTLEVYDILGRKVEMLVSDFQPAGSHEIIWDAVDVPSGMYFYKIQAGDFSQTRKMTLLK
ncbi:MAG: T9SS type A sorting domain-containing protein [candidate division Zixibacteria bacterium]|nr:T9SS type A sorting domain-containing protein [candidate division Zixibacteria bacterium]